MNKQAKWLLLIALLLMATVSAGGVGAWVDADSDPTAAQTCLLYTSPSPRD